MKNLTLKKATITELDRIREIYWKLLDSSEKYASILPWKKEIYPADTDWCSYINKGEMYFICRDTEVLGAVALATAQTEGYRKIKWSINAADHEVAVVHLLAVDPDYQGQGIAAATLEKIIKIAADMNNKAVRLDAIITNEPAQRLYEKFGFVS